MKNLITIEQTKIGAETINSVNSRELYFALEIKKDYSNWAKRQIESLGLEENIDYIKVAQKGELSKTGQTNIDYILVLDTAKHIAMASRSPKGKEVRKYFIEVEKQFAVGLTQYKQVRSQVDLAVRELTSKSIEADKFRAKYYETLEMTNKLLIEKIEAIEKTKENAPIKRRPGTGYALREDEKEMMLELYKQKKPITVIAQTVGRHHSAVSRFLRGQR